MHDENRKSVVENGLYSMNELVHNDNNDGKSVYNSANNSYIIVLNESSDGENGNFCVVNDTYNEKSDVFDHEMCTCICYGQVCEKSAEKYNNNETYIVSKHNNNEETEVSSTSYNSKVNYQKNTDASLLSEKLSLSHSVCYSFFDTLQALRKSNNELFITYINVNSIRHKIVEFEDMFYSKLVDVFAVAETKLSSDFSDNIFKRSGYRLYRKDYRHNEGGLMMYVNTEYPSRRITNLESSLFESIAVEVISGKEKVLLLSIYRNAKISVNHFIADIEKITEKALQKYSKILYMGDFNINVLCESADKHKLLDFCDSFDMENVINEPTCHVGESESLIDLMITNIGESVKKSGALDNGISDVHRFIYAMLPGFSREICKSKIVYRTYKNFSEVEFCKEISQKIPENYAGTIDDFVMKFRQICDKHAPMKMKYIKQTQVPYMNGELRRAIARKSMLRHKSVRCKSKENIEKSRKQRNFVTYLKRMSMNKYFAEKCKNINNNFWDIVKPFLSNKSTSNQHEDFILLEGDNIITDKVTVCNLFNDHFTGVNGKEVSANDDSLDFFIDCLENINLESRHIDEKFEFVPVSVKDVKLKLRLLKAKKSAGYDIIPPQLVKLATNQIAKPLTTIINTNIHDSRFPDELKYANVSPAYKKSDYLLRDNYRPISVLTCFSKIFEGLMADQICKYFEPILSSYVSAFRKGYSCQSLLLKMTEDW